MGWLNVSTLSVLSIFLGRHGALRYRVLIDDDWEHLLVDASNHHFAHGLRRYISLLKILVVAHKL